MKEVKIDEDRLEKIKTIMNSQSGENNSSSNDAYQL
jgi:hypothetical protein